ncbi:MAG TPA: hypothetical protein VM620_07500 [Hyphomicrobium sp.]|jgi:hypothetical protein|nr:hypothetical protein [Hyphomicrobium sp.]
MTAAQSAEDQNVTGGTQHPGTSQPGTTAAPTANRMQEVTL